MRKTLVGKNGYLFLINDSAKSLRRHMYNLVSRKEARTKVITKKAKESAVYFIVFPDKEIICSDFLPDNMKIQHRHDLDLHRNIFGENLLDPTNILEPSDYYKTDTHINNKGALKIFKAFLSFLNQKFKVNLESENIELQNIETDSLSKLSKGIGDLTTAINRQDIVLGDISDTYYKFPQDVDFYTTTYMKDDPRFKILDYNLEDISSKYVNNIVDWQTVSENIFYKKTDTAPIKKKGVIFYDSFLLSSIGLYKNLFSEIYFIKSVFKKKLLKTLRPDLIFEFRVERFLYV